MTSETTPSSAWASFAGAHNVGDIVRASVTKALPFGALVHVTGGIPGLLREVPELTVGDTLDARIDTLDRAKRRVSLMPA